jgi:hypothetical protein
MNSLIFLFLVFAAIGFGINLAQASFEELSQDLYTVTHEFATTYTRRYGTHRYCLQDLYGLLGLFIISAFAVWVCVSTKGTLAVILATAYLILAAFSFCLLATGFFWRGYALKELRRFKAFRN